MGRATPRSPERNYPYRRVLATAPRTARSERRANAVAFETRERLGPGALCRVIYRSPCLALRPILWSAEERKLKTRACYTAHLLRVVGGLGTTLDRGILDFRLLNFSLVSHLNVNTCCIESQQLQSGPGRGESISRATGGSRIRKLPPASRGARAPRAHGRGTAAGEAEVDERG